MKETCFIVQNLTKNTIILSDLRDTKIEPLKTLDLEKVVRRIDIDRSIDLIHAIKNKLLKVIKQIAPGKKIKVEKPLTREELSEVIEKATQEAMKRSMESGQTLDVTKLQESIKRQVAQSISSQLGNNIEGKIDDLLKRKTAPEPAAPVLDERFDVLLDAIKALKDSIPQGGVSLGGNKINEPAIDIGELARIAQQEVENIASEIADKKEEPIKKSKRIKLDTQATDLAKELE